MDREQKQSATQSGIEPVPDESLWELLEQLPDAVLLVGANGAIQHVNPQAARMFGYEPAELVGQSIESLLPERLRARHVQHRHAYAQAARLRPMGAGLELAGRHKSGAEFPVEIMLNPLAGPRAGSTFAVVRDISARKQVERDIQALNQQLRKELRAMQRLHAVSTQRLDEGGLEPLLREILATAVDVSDADFGIMQLPDRRSGALKIAVQRGFAEAVCEFFDSVHARKAAGTTAMDPNERIIVENIDDGGSLFDQDSLRLLRAAGVKALQSTPLVSRSGKFVGVCTTHHRASHRFDESALQRLDLVARQAADLIERAQAEEALAEAKEAAVQANESKTRFLAAASHDLRQPLQTILILQSVLARALKGSDLSQYLTSLEEAVRSMDDLLSALLDINRLESGTIQPTIREFPLEQILPRLRSELSYAAAGKSLALDIDNSAEMVRSDPALLQVILRNLIGNAIKYTSKGHVLVRIRREQDQIHIDVSDSGTGISTAHLERIFEAFYQVGNPSGDKRHGVGLGLSIVQRIARLLDHPIAVASREGRGSTFTIRVPRVAASIQAISEPRRNKPAPERSAQPLKLLHIEDDPAIARALAMLLRFEGYEVTCAASRDEALQLIDIEQLRPDLIVTDYQLPAGVTGDEIVAEIAARLGWKPPTVLLTGDISHEHIRRAASIVDRILSKPVDVDLLLQTLSAMRPPRTDAQAPVHSSV